MAVEKGDLPHANCRDYINGEDRNHDAHTHVLVTLGVPRTYWCQGRPDLTPSDPEAAAEG